MIGKVEAGSASPTAGVLGRLCAGLGIAISALMAAVEREDVVLLRAADQPRWYESATGLVRVPVSRLTPGSVRPLTGLAWHISQAERLPANLPAAGGVRRRRRGGCLAGID